MSEVTGNSGTPQGHAALLAVLDQFAALDRYSRQREEILGQLSGLHYACETEFKSSERTYGYTPDERFRDGRTVIGQLSGSQHQVSIQMPAAANDQIEAMRTGETLSQVCLFVKWSSIYDRFEFQDVPSASLPSEQPEPVEAAPPDPEPEPASEPATEPATEQPVKEEPAIEPPPEEESPPAEPLEISTEEESDPELQRLQEHLVEETEELQERAAPLGEPEPEDLTAEQPVQEEPPVAESAAERPAESSTATLQPLPEADRNALLSGKGPLASAEIIRFLASGFGLQESQVATIVDGLWNYILQSEHYAGRSPKWVLPNFGTFSLSYQGHQPVLAFRSRPLRQLRAQQSKRRTQMATERWIRHYLAQSDRSDHSGLSIKRRISVSVAQQTSEPLAIVHRVVWELMDFVCDLMAEGERTIRWAMRGEMYPSAGTDVQQDDSEVCYEFRMYQRLAKRLTKRLSKDLVQPVRQQSPRERSRQAIRQQPVSMAAITQRVSSFFKGPGRLRDTSTAGRSGGRFVWFSLRWWVPAWLVMMGINFLLLLFPGSHILKDARIGIFSMSLICPFLASILFFFCMALFMSQQGRFAGGGSSNGVNLLLRRSARVFVILGFLIGLLGFGVALLELFFRSVFML